MFSPDDSHGLYITFGVYSSKTNINTTFGSALCGFSMETIRKNFTKEIKNCFKANHRSRLLDAFHGEKRSCTEFDNIDIDDSFCGSGFNRYIEGVDPIQGYHFLTIQGNICLFLFRILTLNLYDFVILKVKLPHWQLEFKEKKLLLLLGRVKEKL